MFTEPVPEFVKYYLGNPEPRVSKWILTNSPLWFLATWVLYFSFITFGGNYMKNRKPYELKKVLMVFNVFQVLLSFFIFKEVLTSAINMRYNVACQPWTNDATNPDEFRMVKAFWYFYLSKFIDLMDTMFLVLKKKDRQLSFLHVYHHSTMLFNWYLGVLYLPGAQTFLTVLANSLVHVIMYSYYFLAAMGPAIQKYLWWKKYMTQLQLIQFFIMVFHVAAGLIVGCNIPKWLAWFTINYLFTLIALFGNFYRQSYTSKKQEIKIENNNVNGKYMNEKTEDVNRRKEKVM